MIENPYYDYAIVRDLAMFFGREQLLNELYMSCIQRQCFSLVGTRFSGKSSLLSHMASRAMQERVKREADLRRHVFVHVDMRYYLQHTLESFFEEIALQIRGRAPGEIELPSREGKGADSFTKILQRLHEEGYHTILLMDTFDRVADEKQFGPHFFSFLRAPATRGWISYVTASLKPLHQISTSEEASPLFIGFKLGQIGPLTREEAIQLITVPAKGAGQEFSDEEVGWIFELVGRHPFFLQRACGHLFQAKSGLKAGQSVEYPSVRQKIMEELQPRFEEICKKLSAEQLQILRLEITQATSGTRKMEELSESGLFRSYVSEALKIRPLAPEHKDVREALENLDDRAFLQASPLTKMGSIEREEDGSATASNKRGLLVQELLRSGFERMKPSGTRNDTGIEWRQYNILYYHYFKYHLANGQTAARLGISRRQFYREQEKAIQTLIDTIMEIDGQFFISFEKGLTGRAGF